ncbi:MAG TPA: tetratricopeptide repeat protein [Bryobacteraceae bacterium]|jgi:tetratricopeptide (TPR) repeat protein|nr:tetratricopeptide repeat protein [Bryobacteraceae bacterium]
MIKKPTVTGTRGKIAVKTSVTTKGLSPESPNPSCIQLKIYEEAVSLFSQAKLPEALQRFLDAAKGPAPHISDKARSYAQVCERRTATFDLKLHTAEDHFNYGVERLNARDVDRAKDHLNRALKLQPDADHVLYTIALCCGLAGDSNGACENLKRAIDLEPRNRILARQDPEFSALATQLPALRALLAGG